MVNPWEAATALTEKQLAEAERRLEGTDFSIVEENEIDEPRDFVIKPQPGEIAGVNAEQIKAANDILSNEKIVDNSTLAGATLSEGYTAPAKPLDRVGEHFATPYKSNRPAPAPEKKGFFKKLFGG